MPDGWEMVFAGEAATAAIAAEAQVRRWRQVLLTLQVLLVIAALALLSLGIAAGTSSPECTGTSGSSSYPGSCSEEGQDTEEALLIITGGLIAGMAAASFSLSQAIKKRNRAMGNLGAEGGRLVAGEMQERASGIYQAGQDWSNKLK